MELVSFKNSLDDHLVTHKTINDVVSQIQVIPAYEKLKLDPELTLFICRYIENTVNKKKSTCTIDKSTIALSIFEGVFPDLTEDEKNYVKKQIQYFWSNKMIKRKGFIVKYGIFAFNLLKKKFI